MVSGQGDVTMKLHVRLRQDGSGYPPFSAEEVQASEVGDHLFRLESVPSFAFGLAFGDVVRAEHHGEARWVEELVSASGHSTVRVIPLGSARLDDLKVALKDRGCTLFPGVVSEMLAVDVPRSVDFEELRAYLLVGRESGVWDFSVGVRGDGA